MKYSLAAAALAATVFAAPQPSMSNLKRIRQATPQITDDVILNYALTLEHLEDKFYRDALSAYTADQFAAAGFDATFYNNLKTISADETTHVAFLTGALKSIGKTPVAEATYDFGYQVPNNVTASIKGFVMTASILEGVGVSAYLGAAAEIVNADYLTAAGSILTVESRHSSYIRASLKESPFPSPFDVPLDFNEVYTLAAPFITAPPANSPTLPVKAFPSLKAAGSGASVKTGDTITLSLAPGVSVVPADGKSPLYAAFITVTGPVFALATPSNGGYSVVVPKADTGKAPVAGQSYVVLTGCNTTVTDDTVVAGPAIIEITPS